MDELSSILRSLSLSSCALGTISAAAPWGIRFLGAPKVTSYSVAEGVGCWLRQSGFEPVHLDVGDTVLITAGSDDIILSSSPDTPYRNIQTLFESSGAPEYQKIFPPLPLNINCGDPSRSISSRILGMAYGVDEHNALIKALPRVHIFRGSNSSFTYWAQQASYFLSVQQVRAGAGYAANALPLAELILITVIREYILGKGLDQLSPSWIKGLNDRRIAKALAAIHALPGSQWSVASLAKEAGMSRTAFALRFSDLIGTTPIDYLTEWRINLARDVLRQGRRNVARIAEDLGYQSEAAFRKAFKIRCGVPPSHFTKANGQDGSLISFQFDRA